MVTACIIGGATCLGMILSVLFFPQIKIKRLSVDTYWVIALFGAILTIAFRCVDLDFLGKELVKDTSVNPLKILALFISMTLLSVFLDEVGFFSYLACKTLKLAGKSQTKLFICLYVVVSVLTVFTSNDIIVLTFTPFICYFCKNAKINPVPFLVAEFVAANTMSMMLIIGNPTNIYIASSYGIAFIDYFKIMVLPTLASSLIAFLILYLMFKKQLKKEIQGECSLEKIKSKPLLIVGLVLLAVCTLLLAIGSYIGLDMWLVAVCCACLLIVVVLIVDLVHKDKPKEIANSLKRAPWQLVPFVLSMFVIILALQQNGLTKAIADFLGKDYSVLKYGVTSFLTANVINNIPMSVLFSELLSGAQNTLGSVYATIVGSNIGAYLTPIGALAGIMWSGILRRQGTSLSFGRFVRYGGAVALPTLFATLGVLLLLV